MASWTGIDRNWLVPAQAADELSLDAFGLFFVVGLAIALFRRFVQRPLRIDPTSHFALILALLLVIIE